MWCHKDVVQIDRSLRDTFMLKKFLGSTSGRGISWTMFGFVTSYGIRLASTLVLTRLLAPEAFGLMSLAWTFLTVIGMLSDIGTTASVVRSPRGDEPEFLDTAWSIHAVRGLWIGGIVLVIAWPASWLYDEPKLFPILCALAISPVIQGLSTMSTATCLRHQQLGRLTLLGTGTHILTTMLNVLFAWWLQSVWGLVIGAILGVIVNVIGGYLVLPAYRPRLRFERLAMAEIVSYGRWILLGTLFTYFGGQGTTAIMGLEVPAETLGLITIATTISWALGDLVGRVLGQVAFPTFARVMREGGNLAEVVRKIKKLIFFLILPGFITISLLGQQIIDLLYDPRYAEAGRFLSFFALNGALGVLSMPYQNAMLAVGDSKAHSIVMGAHATCTVLLMLGGAYLYGIYGMISGIGLALLVSFSMSVFFARKHSILGIVYDVATICIIIAFYLFNAFQL